MLNKQIKALDQIVLKFLQGTFG